MTEDEWKIIGKGFNDKWNFPHCAGAIDGKHVEIQSPPNSGSDFFNYKKRFSIILLALVDHDYCFTFVDIGATGRANDAGVFEKSNLKHAIENNLLLIPENYVFVADDAFPLKSYIVKPYSKRNLSVREKICNYRISRARRISENAFGILAARFRVFRKPIDLDVPKVIKLVKATCALHNWLRKMSTNYITQTTVDREDLDEYTTIRGDWRDLTTTGLVSLRPLAPVRPSLQAMQVRNQYCNYFNGEGAVLWQNKMIS